MHLIRENMDKQLARCDEAPFYTLGLAHDRRRARLRSHHLGDRRGDDRQAERRCSATSRRKSISACRIATTSKRGVIASDRGARGRLGERTSTRKRAGRAVEGAVRVPVGGPVQSVARSGDRAGVPRRNPARRRRQAGPFLFDVWAEILQHGTDAAGPSGSGARMEEKSVEFRKKGSELYVTAAPERSE